MFDEMVRLEREQRDSNFEARLRDFAPEDVVALAAELGAGKGKKPVSKPLKRGSVVALMKQFSSIKTAKLPTDHRQGSHEAGYGLNRQSVYAIITFAERHSSRNQKVFGLFSSEILFLAIGDAINRHNS